jgi:DNA polymerase-3 subunit gamma/tau
MAAALSASKGQDTAAHGIEESTFALKDDTVEIQTTVSKTMLPVVINADATKILQATLRIYAPGLKLSLLPGVPADPSAKKVARPAKAGSVAELAEKHPVVQEARRLFSAEISNIVDLRDK